MFVSGLRLKTEKFIYELTDRKGHLLIKKITKIDFQAKNRTGTTQTIYTSLTAGRVSWVTGRAF